MSDCAQKAHGDSFGDACHRWNVLLIRIDQLVQSNWRESILPEDRAAVSVGESPEPSFPPGDLTVLIHCRQSLIAGCT